MSDQSTTTTGRLRRPRRSAAASPRASDQTTTTRRGTRLRFVDAAALPTARASAPAPDATPADAIAIHAHERAIVGPQVAAFAERLADPESRREYEAVLAALDTGEISGRALQLFGAFLELALSTGRIRQSLGQHAEDTVRRVFERTPRGAALSASAAEVTRALAPLIGQPLGDLRLSLVRPGTYRLVLETERYRVSLGLAPAGAHVESLELNL